MPMPKNWDSEHVPAPMPVEQKIIFYCCAGMEVESFDAGKVIRAHFFTDTVGPFVQRASMPVAVQVTLAPSLPPAGPSFRVGSAPRCGGPFLNLSPVALSLLHVPFRVFPKSSQNRNPLPKSGTPEALLLAAGGWPPESGLGCMAAGLSPSRPLTVPLPRWRRQGRNAIQRCGAAGSGGPAQPCR